jgi:GNAT superfamily N-acetyltransferase
LRIEELDRASDVAWPAVEQVMLGPWKLRATSGVTRRANSVLPLAPGSRAREDEGDVGRMIEAAEEFYRARSLPCTFYVTPFTWPRKLDVVLERRGYSVGPAAAEVWVASVGELVAGRGSEGVRLAESPGAEWWDCAFEEDSPRNRAVHEEITKRSPTPKVFASAMVGDGVASCGGAVIVDGCAGIFCMRTREAYRRRGLAAEVLAALLKWAVVGGAGLMYLQVVAENEGAKWLYRRAGFWYGYSYHYRVR